MIGKRSMAHLQINYDIGVFVTGSTGHLGLTKDCFLPPIVMFGQGPSSTTTPISIKIMEESSMELGGSTSTLPSGDRAVFPNSELVSATTTSSSITLTIPSVELCGIESNNTVKFCRVLMEQSPPVSDIPEPRRIWTGIWMSLELVLMKALVRTWSSEHGAQFLVEPR